MLNQRAMNDTSSKHCSRCGAALPADAPQGLCPRCLGALGVATETDVPGEGAASRQAPLSPEELAPHFPQLEILELLGRGGMGVVYKARQKSLNRLVALKLLVPEREKDAAFAQRFAAEAETLARLSHPNIVTIYDFGQVIRNQDKPANEAARESIYYFIMEFVDGVTLRQLLTAGRIAPREALAIVPQICDALQYAHDRGIVHRDIKPENILLDRQGHVKVADFGVAKIVGNELPESAAAVPAPSASHTETGAVMGTPQYMAPEQREHPQEVDHRADIYSLGVVFYQMLTGELPSQRIEPPSKKVVVDVRLDEVVLRALERQPERRYQQVSEVKTQVETIASTQRAAALGLFGKLQDWGLRRWRRPAVPVVQVRNGRRQINWPAFWFRLVNGGAVIIIIWLLGGPWPMVALVAIVVATKIASEIFLGLASPLEQSQPLAEKEPPKPTTPGIASSERASRFSRTAIAGAFCIPLLFLAYIGSTIPASGVGNGVSFTSPPAFAVTLAGFFLPTVLGWIAVRQIHRSPHRIGGLWLALVAALCTPLIVLDLFLFSFLAYGIGYIAALAEVPGREHPLRQVFEYHQMFWIMSLQAMVLVFDWLVIRSVWRVLKSPHRNGPLFLAGTIGALVFMALSCQFDFGPVTMIAMVVLTLFFTVLNFRRTLGRGVVSTVMMLCVALGIMFAFQIPFGSRAQRDKQVQAERKATEERVFQEALRQDPSARILSVSGNSRYVEIKGIGRKDARLMFTANGGGWGCGFVSDSVFTAIIARGWLGRLDCVVTDAKGHTLLTHSTDSVGSMSLLRGRIVFSQDRVKPEPDGTFVVAEFHPKEGKPLLIRVAVKERFEGLEVR